MAHDWGSAVAYSYAAAHPQDVKKMVILDIVLPGFDLEEATNFHQMDYGTSHLMQLEIYPRN